MEISIPVEENKALVIKKASGKRPCTIDEPFEGYTGDYKLALLGEKCYEFKDIVSQDVCDSSCNTF